MLVVWGTMALRLANAPLLPLDVEAYATALDGFVARLDEIPIARRGSTSRRSAPPCASWRRPGGH